MVGLFFGGELAGQAGYDSGGSERISCLDECGEDIASGDDEKRDVLSEALGDGDGLGKEHLLVFAEQLLGGFDVLRTTGSHHPGSEHNDVLRVRVGVGESPLESEG